MRSGAGGKSISVPLRILDKCYVCASVKGLRVCNSCASRIYCSRECQKKDWKEHKPWCSATVQINLKVFYPLIAYMMEFMRCVTSQFHNVLPRPHPAFNHKIIRAPLPGVRKSTESDSPIHHTVTLGARHTITDLSGWWKAGLRAHGDAGCLKLFHHCGREHSVYKIIIATTLALLAEVYSTYHVLTSEPPFVIEGNRPRFRLEYGKSPIADFGICKGKVRGKTHRVQTWTYYDPATETRTTPLDPENHYWIYFKALSGEELVLDCCSYSFGMEATVDASPCLETLPPMMCIPGSSRVPAYLRSSRDTGGGDKLPYTLVEEKRFSVMQNTELQKAIATEVDPRGLAKDSDEVKIVRAFMDEVLGEACTDYDVEAMLWWRMNGAGILREVLTGRSWLEWEKPMMHQKSLFDCGENLYDITTKGVKDISIFYQN
ncbi:hypothetical protein P691DRAFT_656267 [Macrolepiota fuliginosa MF-IS2]|uniref:MYND-type domain-containing protein n=1 Tax=Macrolepiota fuliginosa MF-IS2 TaxID=1400762 RepID=A0A9P5XRP8_9AGAR|nr:hypothetical protein P691DRAFT_656267 [Macrolepiota fuliginosa MF-IS2]